MATLRALKARQVLDSRGRPTVEVDAIADGGAVGRAIVPSGASTGRHEALELRDGDPGRYAGLGVGKAVENVRAAIAPAIAGMDLDDQAAIDAALLTLDGTPNKSKLGANALLGVSMAVAHAAAAARGEELFVHVNRLWKGRAAGLDPAVPREPTMPLPMVNMISGGLHAGRNLDIQDVLFIPTGAESYSHALETIVAMYRAVGGVLKELGAESVLVGDEGGYGPKLEDDEQALRVVVDAMLACGLTPGVDGHIALDVASTHFFDPATSSYKLSNVARPMDSAGMVDLLAGWVDRYPILSIEDGVAEGDFVIALYNPASKARPYQLGQAFDLLRKLKEAATPVLFVRAAGTDEAKVVLTTLGAADASVADMRTLVIVGASTTRQVGRWIYTPRSERRT